MQIYITGFNSSNKSTTRIENFNLKNFKLFIFGLSLVLFEKVFLFQKLNLSAVIFSHIMIINESE